MEVEGQIEQEAPATPEKSLEDTIREAIHTPKADEVAAPAEVTPEPVQTDAARDEQGRFAKGGKEARVKPEGEQAAPAEAAPVQVAAIKPPDGWTAAAKAEFDKLPPLVQAEVTRREADMHKKFTTQDDERNFGKKVRETLNPYMATIIQEGGTPERAIDELFRTAMILRSPNPQVRQQALRTIAHQFNVDLGSLQQAATQQAPGVHPEQVSQLVQAEIDKWRQTQETTQLTSEIDKFAADPANIHFETVKPVMAALLSSGQAKDLPDAYNQAIWANPDIRSSLTASQTSAAEGQRLAVAKAATEAARRAGGSVTGGPGSAKALNGTGKSIPIEETIRAALRESQGRV